jgi:hypothetical protein
VEPSDCRLQLTDLVGTLRAARRITARPVRSCQARICGSCPRAAPDCIPDMGGFVQKYSDDQREAMVSAKVDRGATYPRIVELAAAGELTRSNGEKLAPFEITAMYAGDIIRGEIRRRTGKAATDLAKLPPRDAIEALRRRLLSACDHMLTATAKREAKAIRAGDMALLRDVAETPNRAGRTRDRSATRTRRPATRQAWRPHRRPEAGRRNARRTRRRDPRRLRPFKRDTGCAGRTRHGQTPNTGQRDTATHRPPMRRTAAQQRTRTSSPVRASSLLPCAEHRSNGGHVVACDGRIGLVCRVVEPSEYGGPSRSAAWPAVQEDPPAPPRAGPISREL